MIKEGNMTRRNFIGTMAAGGSSLMAGRQSESTPETTPRNTPRTVAEDKHAYYFGYGSDLPCD